jgi:CHAT domain-containing protein
MSEGLYLWQWQIGRLLSATGELDNAIDAYRQATYTLQSIRQDLTIAQQGRQLSFRQVASPLFLGLTDMLLQRAAQRSPVGGVSEDLVEARDTVELLKAAELQDYFEDECVSQLQAKQTTIDDIQPNTAAIYPIFLPTRMELLVSTTRGLLQVTVKKSEIEMTDEIRRFRIALETRNSNRYRRHARNLYDWIVRPLENILVDQKIETLVVIPEGALRTVPMAALFDEKSQKFLIEKYAIATAPGLTLIDPQPIARENISVLITGITESVQDFPALPNVGEELDSIEQIIGGKVLRDADFLESSVEQELRTNAYTVVHVASHGEFSSDPAKSFLLTYDGRLNMNELEKYVKFGQFREEPLELLTLSACQTAAGDDRAALGLAGIAVKAGARSALATLWFINDRASSQLISEVYRNLGNGELSKAKALQMAQVSFLKDRRYRHPSYWSPFLLIGNWL